MAGAVLVCVLASSSSASEHLVTSSQVQAALAEQAHQRAVSVAQIDAFLGLQAAQQAVAASAGSLARARAVLETLSDAELVDLAARAQALTHDKAAGGTGTRVVVVVLVVLLALYVALYFAAGCSGNPQCLT